MLDKGKALPISIGEFVPDTTVDPTSNLLGCRMYLFSPSL